MAVLTPAPKIQFFDSSGSPLVGGKLYSYAAGTTTPLATYTDNSATSTNTNPVILDSRGEASVWLGAGPYKLRLATATNVDIWTVDNIYNETDQLFSATGSSLVGFISNGTGATYRTVQSKLRERVSVLDFGAVASASVDNSSAFLACWNFIYSTGGGTMYIPEGEYGIVSFAPAWSSTTTVDIVGAGKRATKLVKFGNSSSPVFNASNNVLNLSIYSTFSSFSIIGSSSAPALRLTNCARFSLVDLYLTTNGGNVGFDNRGSLIFTCQNVDIANNTIGYQQDVYNSIYCNLISWIGGSVTYNSTTGVKLNRGATLNFAGVDFEVNGTASNLTTGAVRIVDAIAEETSLAQVSFEGCWFERNNGIAFLSDISADGLSVILRDVKIAFNEGGRFASIGAAAASLTLNNIHCNDTIDTAAYTSSIIGCTMGVGSLNDLGYYRTYEASIVNGIYVPFGTGVGTSFIKITPEGNFYADAINASAKISAGAVNTTQSAYYALTPSSYTGLTFLSNSAAAAGTGWSHFYGQSSLGAVANIQILGNGNILNANNSYGGISDIKVKENIVDATSKLEDLSKVRIVNYNIIGSEAKQIGVISQELEQIFPGMIEESPDRDATGNDLGTTTKSVKYSVFVPILIKALQELKSEFDQYKTTHP